MNILKRFFQLFKGKKPKKFGEIAIHKGLASEKDIKEALRTQKEYMEKHQMHKEIGAILSEKGVLTPEDVNLILDEQKRQDSLMAWFYAFFRLSH